MASNATQIAISNSNEVLDPELFMINRGSSTSLSSFSSSFDGNDLISFRDGNLTCATELSSRPSSAMSSLSDELPPSYIRAHSNIKKIKGESIYVMISNTNFAVPRDAYQRMEKLNWLMDKEGVRHLNTSPAIFEVLLSHIVFESLPAYDTLSEKEYNEFEPLALSLELYNLIEHFGRSSDKTFRRRRHHKEPPSAKKERRRSLLSMSRKKQQKEHKGKPIVLNKENTSMTSVKLMSVNSKCARFVASVKQKGVAKLGVRCVKSTHAELCASAHIN